MDEVEPEDRKEYSLGVGGPGSCPELTWHYRLLRHKRLQAGLSWASIEFRL